MWGREPRHQYVGRWTNALYELISSNKNSAENSIKQVGIRGAFGAPAQNYFAFRHVMVVGSGIGVTPLLSVWKHLVAKADVIDAKPMAKKFTKEAQTPIPHERLSDEEEEQRWLESVDVNSVDVVSFKHNLRTVRAKAAYCASVLESMTVNIYLFIYSLFSEVVVFSVWLYQYDTEAAILEVAVSAVAMLIFASKVCFSFLAYGRRYMSSFVFMLEFMIIVLDGVALVTSVTHIHSPSRKEAISYFVFFSAFILLHAVRIFHIFYATARPPKTELALRQTKGDSQIDSVTGIWISRTFSSMSFAASDLVDTVADLSPAFSLQLYSTREKQSELDTIDPFRRCHPRHALHGGRPNWTNIFTEAIENAHDSNPEGEAVGIFFCGSPAIAREMKRVARDVTMQHGNKTCNCRLLVHKENF
eukprot:scaffold204526_cov51-Attheya_sp.AAC.1